MVTPLDEAHIQESTKTEVFMILLSLQLPGSNTSLQTKLNST